MKLVKLLLDINVMIVGENIRNVGMISRVGGFVENVTHSHIQVMKMIYVIYWINMTLNIYRMLE
jgi:hypothetical protein